MSAIDDHRVRILALWAAMKAFYPKQADIRATLNGHTNHGDGYRYYASIEGAPKQAVSVTMDLTRGGEAIKVEVQAGDTLTNMEIIATYEGAQLKERVCD